MKAKRIDKERVYNDGFSAFIEEIRNGNVLLMVGHSFESNQEVFRGTFYDYILSRLNAVSGTEGLDFSDLSYDNRFLLDKNNPNHIRNLHEEIVRIIDENEYSAQEDVSKNLIRLISTGFFKFVFTTSFDPLVEIAMKEKFGDVRVMNIYDKANRDVASVSDLDIPTIYYLFGKAMLPKENEKAKKFAATDNDALEVIRKWQTDMANSSLLRYTSDKYILTLGCTQDDWLFRFIWYTLKGDSGNLSRGVIAEHAKSESLSHYLKMNHILIDNNADEVIEKIMNAVNTFNQDKWSVPANNCDVFISYSRADSEIAQKLYDSLTKVGLSVWYDKYNLGGKHGGKFMDALKEAVDTSTIFIALLSPSITKQSHDIHIYRREWEWAKELKWGLCADSRCYAAYSDDYDINSRKYQDALGWLAESDNFEFVSSNPCFDECALQIQKRINQIKAHATD
ncbi:MAG: toll/interleukin-1 receptor domain-containing protein [Bacteroidaceae bacterium]|nr:toll/interleukin-1 receptor domain-containing protein [Bacteroidaceae bacterium]